MEVYTMKVKKVTETEEEVQISMPAYVIFKEEVGKYHLKEGKLRITRFSLDPMNPRIFISYPEACDENLMNKGMPISRQEWLKHLNTLKSNLDSFISAENQQK